MARLASFYTGVSVFVTNALFVPVAANLGAALYLAASKSQRAPPAGNPVTDAYGERVYAAYPEWAREDVEALLAEAWNRPLGFEAFAHFTETGDSGTWVNVHPRGFRIVENQGPWPPDRNYFNVFIFGGSTRQRILFRALLVAGAIPDLAVFIDRLNDLHAGFSREQPLDSDAAERTIASLDDEGAIDPPRGFDVRVHRAAWFGAKQVDARRTDFGERLLWLGDPFRDIRAPLHVDAAHYNANASEHITRAVADHMQRLALLGLSISAGARSATPDSAAGTS